MIDRHWFRGGYPDSYLAVDDATAHQWCEDFITSYVERHLPQLGITAAPLLLRRLCSMLAHQQGATLNLSKMAGSLGIDGKTARHYIDLLEGLYLVRCLPAWSRNAGKRLVKASKVYWRDSGLLHSLSGLHDLEKVLGHPVCGHSWEGYCIEQMIPLLPKGETCGASLVNESCGGGAVGVADEADPVGGESVGEQVLGGFAFLNGEGLVVDPSAIAVDVDLCGDLDSVVGCALTAELQ